MAKRDRGGNQAVGGITQTPTTKPTYTYEEPTGTAGNTSGGSSSTGTKTTTKTSTKTSTGTSSSTATGVYTPSYADQFYAALAAGIPVSDTSAEDGAQRQAMFATREILDNARASVPTVNVNPIGYVDITGRRSQLRQAEELAKRQAVNSADYAVNTAVEQLRRNEADAAGQFQTQRDQIAADGQRALDNQALYAEARGDRGGIGRAQYGSIQNTAAVNRNTVNSAQTKLATDTQRQITDLQAQGEFEKADKLLEISQKYLSELMDLEQWAQGQNISIEEFNKKLEQWNAEYRLDAAKYLTDAELKAAGLTGILPNGAETAAYRNDRQNRLINSGKAMMSAGLIPSDEQLEAMRWSPEQYWVWKMAQGAYV